MRLAHGPEEFCRAPVTHEIKDHGKFLDFRKKPCQDRTPMNLPSAQRAFTLTELLVVTATGAMLAAASLPSGGLLSQPRAQDLACLNNKRQLSAAWLMYANDNDSKLAANWPTAAGVPSAATNNWAFGNMKIRTEATNFTLLQQGTLFPYTGETGPYHCPADLSETNGRARVRSYSMNGWIGSTYMTAVLGESGYQTYLKENAMATKGTSAIWVFIDEHEASIDDTWFEVTMNDSAPFASFPASRHRRGYNLSFADGHVEHNVFRDPSTQWSAQYSNTKNPDWINLKQVTTMGFGQ